MPKTRLELFTVAKDAYVATKAAAISLAALSARCTAVLVEEHDESRLHPEVGADAVALLSEAKTHALKARDCIMRAHPMLRAIPDDFNGPVDYGFDETYEDKPKRAKLSVAA